MNVLHHALHSWLGTQRRESREEGFASWGLKASWLLGLESRAIVLAVYLTRRSWRSLACCGNGDESTKEIAEKQQRCAADGT